MRTESGTVESSGADRAHRAELTVGPEEVLVKAAPLGDLRLG